MSDRASMYATLETRVPYMDREFVDFCLKLPPNARLNKGSNKYLLRKLFSDELPQYITEQKKVGMNEGAGYGANASELSIYYQAVEGFYQKNSERFKADRKLCQAHSSLYQINLSDIEEIYNFSRFYEHSYHKLECGRSRLQLNGRLL